MSTTTRSTYIRLIDLYGGPLDLLFDFVEEFGVLQDWMILAKLDSEFEEVHARVIREMRYLLEVVGARLFAGVGCKYGMRWQLWLCVVVPRPQTLIN